MTDAQKFKFYFPAWSAAVKANGWRMEAGRLVSGWGEATDEPAREDARPTSAELVAITTFARQRAITAGRSLKVDDLRHGAHVLALGRDKSSEDLTNAELDRVVTLFQLLTNPDDLSARLKWDAYQRGEDPGSVQRVEWFIRRCPDAYVRAVCHGKFGTKNWESLTLGQKRSLSLTLKNRKIGRAGTPLPAATGAQETARPTSADPDWSVE